MNEDFPRFFSLSPSERGGIFENVTEHIDTAREYIEKDFWICWILDFLFNGLSDRPEFLFKGGTSLSKVYGLIDRFSEDIDLVIPRDYLGFVGDRDPFFGDLSGARRKRLFEELRVSSSEYVNGRLKDSLSSFFPDCDVTSDKSDKSGQSLRINYPTLYEFGDNSYVLPYVKLEFGSRSSFEPNSLDEVRPYLSDFLASDWDLTVRNLRVISPSRTYLDKLLILHGYYHGYVDSGRLPGNERISRHYYDVARMTRTDFELFYDVDLFPDVRSHTRVAFPSSWRRYDLAEPGSLRLVPDGDLLSLLRNDYDLMSSMMFGDIPDFLVIVDEISRAESLINGT